MSFLIQLAKQRFKFSSTHFTIFDEKRAECLHGHNYQIAVDFEFEEVDAKTGLAVEFSILKNHIQEVCDYLDEKVLVPTTSPYLKIKKTFTNMEVTYAEKFYSFPKQDCVLLEIPNTSSESLAQWFYEELDKKLGDLPVAEFSVTLEETEGQSVTFG